jgi:outer membrane protein assembly factor BamB
MVYVSGIDPGSQPGVTSSSIVALDALTGEQRWQSRTPSISSFLAATDRRVYSGDSSGSFYALDGATGAEVWTFQGVEAGWSAPAVAGGVVYVGQSDFTGDIPNAASLDKQMFALDAATGREIWRFEADDWVSDPVVASGVVYFTTMNHAWRSGDGEHSLYALDVESGDLLWQFKADSRLLSSIVGNETAYAVAYSGPVYALGQAEEATPTAVAQPTVDGASTPTPEASSPTVVPAASLVPVAAATATSVIAPVSTPAVVGAPQAGMPRTGSDGMDGIASGAAYLALAAMLVLMGVALALRRKRKL